MNSVFNDYMKEKKVYTDSFKMFKMKLYLIVHNTESCKNRRKVNCCRKVRNIIEGKLKPAFLMSWEIFFNPINIQGFPNCSC